MALTRTARLESQRERTFEHQVELCVYIMNTIICIRDFFSWSQTSSKNPLKKQKIFPVSAYINLPNSKTPPFPGEEPGPPVAPPFPVGSPVRKVGRVCFIGGLWLALLSWNTGGPVEGPWKPRFSKGFFFFCYYYWVSKGFLFFSKGFLLLVFVLGISGVFCLREM